MNVRNWAAGLLLLLFTWISSAAHAQWSGYINGKTLPDRPYGFMATASAAPVFSKLKLVCFSPAQFRLYLDERITRDVEVADVQISVDKLSVLALRVELASGGFIVSNQQPDFWKLIAQMSAGAVLLVNTGSGEQHRYSLFGFTKTYVDTCGWLDAASNYQVYLSRYR